MGSDPTVWSTAFLSALVHELRTPVASLLLTADLLAADPRLDPRHARYARSLEEAAADLQALLDEVGELNRLRAGRVEVRRAAVPVEEVLDAALEPVRADASPAAPTLLADVRDGVPRDLVTDGALLARALTALVRSALAGGARRVEIRVGLEPAGGETAARTCFDVIDDGDMVPPGELARLFAPFAPALSRTRRAHGGTSLGLAVAAALAGLLGAELEALPAAAAGPGLMVRLVLPAT
jgi:signal transduction histidine kinase